MFSFINILIGTSGKRQFSFLIFCTQMFEHYEPMTRNDNTARFQIMKTDQVTRK